MFSGERGTESEVSSPNLPAGSTCCELEQTQLEFRTLERNLMSIKTYAR